MGVKIRLESNHRDLQIPTLCYTITIAKRGHNGGEGLDKQSRSIDAGSRSWRVSMTNIYSPYSLLVIIAKKSADLGVQAC